MVGTAECFSISRFLKPGINSVFGSKQSGVAIARQCNFKFPWHKKHAMTSENERADQIRACTYKNKMASKFGKIANFDERFLLY